MALVAALLALAGCGTTRTADRTTAPAADTSNAAAGDRRRPTAIIKSMGGGLVGGSIGAGLERRREAHARWRPSTARWNIRQGGQPVTWKGDSAGTYGEVVAAQPYRVGSQDCRQYTHTVVQDGQSQTARGTACRNADGSWTPLT